MFYLCCARIKSCCVMKELCFQYQWVEDFSYWINSLRFWELKLEEVNNERGA